MWDVWLLVRCGVGSKPLERNIVSGAKLGRLGRSFLTLMVLLTVLVLLTSVAVGQTSDPKGSDTFGDVPVGHWADEEIGWAVANGITRGVGEGRFDLDGIVSRAQIFTFLYRTVNLLQDTPVSVLGSQMFDDVPVGHWADEEVGWAVSNGVVSGVDGRTFNLDGTVSRAEMVTFIQRTVNLIQGRPVTTTTDPDGAILFTNSQDGDHEIFVTNADGTVLNADGTNVRQLTNNIYHDGRPSWSPDGTQIAFESDRDGDLAEIFVMNADGTNVRQLTNSPHYDEAPSWSPDGTQIAFQSDRDGDLEIFVMNADGTNVRQLTNNIYHDRAPSWSPDGTQIAFESDRDGDLEIFVMNADGTNVRQLTNNTPHHDWAPSWSPDGTRIAFTSDRGRGWQVFVMNADGTNEQQLTPNSINNGFPSWSPDGTQITFTNDLGLPNNFEIYTMNADGTNRSRITNNTTDSKLSSQAWSSHTLGGGSDFFDDVPKGHEADRAIGWAFRNGITSGVGGGLFGPDGTITRAQIVTFLYRTVNLLGGTPGDASDTTSDQSTVRVGVSSSLERCASAGQPGSGVLVVLAGTPAAGFYEPIVGPGGSCERIMGWWEQARRAEAERIDRGEYPCQYLSPPEGYDFGDAGRTHGPPYFVGCWPQITSHDAAAQFTYPPNSPPFVEAVWNCYKMALEGSPPGWDGYWWPTIVDCHYLLLFYGYPVRGMGIDPACAAESYTRRVAEDLIGERSFDDDGYYSGPNSWTNCSTRAERMVPDTGQTFQQRCRAVIAAAAKDPHAAENIEQQAAVYGVEPADYLTEWGNIVCGDWSRETIKNAEINGIPLDGRVFIAYWHARPEAQCHQQVILNLAESYLRGGASATPGVRFC